jgi:predicted small metal-binding protein
MLKKLRTHYMDMKTITCREVGFDCDTIVRVRQRMRLCNVVLRHAMTVHGMKENDCTPEFKEKVRGLIRTS